MARPITITDEQILEAARTVFLKDGMNASTVEIARLAGVSEGSIFRRFPTKDALFRAAIKPPSVPSWVRELDLLSGQGEMHDNLIRIVHEIIRFAQERIPFAMLGWSHKPSSDSVCPDEEAPIVRDDRQLARFLQQEVERGRLRACQVDMVTRLLLGPCLNLVLDSVVNKQPLTDEEIDRFTADLVETLWQGIAPPAA
jgi:AcrR family transcriptional regulator